MKNGSYEDIIYYYNNTPSLFKGIYKHSLGYLVRKNYKGIYASGGFFLKEPIDYLGLMAFVLPFFSKEINEFVVKRELFDTAYLIGNYDECHRLLNYIETNVSYSSWGATNHIRLAELENGAEAMTETFNKITESSDSIIFNEICSYARDAASIDASTTAWYEQKYKNDVMAYSHTPWQKDFIISHLHPYKSYGPGEWMSIDMLSSIIDLYVNFIFNLRLLLPLHEQFPVIITYLKKIHSVIHDRFLDKYCRLIGIQTAKQWERRDELIEALFFKQPSNIDRHEAENYINENPCDIDFIIEYTKAVVDCGQKNKFGKCDGSVIERIKFHLFHYLQREDPAIHLKKLEIICNSNPSLIAFRQLNMVLDSMENKNINDYALSYWCYSYESNLLDTCFFHTEDSRLADTLKRWEELGLLQKSNINIRIAFNLMLVKPSEFEIPVAKLEEKCLKNEIPPYIRGMILSHIIENYLLCKKYRQVVSLFVDNVMAIPSLNISIDKRKIFDLFTREVDIEIDSPLDLSIFYTMLDAKPVKIQANAYRYVTSQGVDRPSKLKIDRGNKKQIYYLAKVVDRNILDLFPLVFSKPADTIEERFKICMLLYDISRNKKYRAEMNELAKDLGIMKMLKEVDASKIDVDENMLKKHEMKQGIDLFKLYRETNKNLKTYVEGDAISNLFPVESDEEANIESHSSRKKIVSYKYLQFTRFYLYVRDQFLLNDKAGLDYYMSSRIRHGTIVNQLRHHLQEMKLTSRKNDEGQYDMNVYWAESVLKLTGPEYVKCLEAFLRFTNSVDLIINDLKNIKVQVKTDEYNQQKAACFDYSFIFFANRIESLYSEDITDYQVCVDAIFNDMWERAEECFVAMKDILHQTEMKLKSTIEALKIDVHNITEEGNAGLSIFNDTLTSCQTFLHEDIKAISGWFQRKQSSGYDFSLQQLIDATMEAVNKINATQIICEQSVHSSSILSSRYLNVFFDLFHNIFTNVVAHAKTDKGQTKCSLVIEEVGEMLKISIRNEIAPKEVETAKQKIVEYNYFSAHREQNPKSSNSRSEGKSGIYKIDTIVYYQLKDEGNLYSPRIEGSDYFVEIFINMRNIRVSHENTIN